MFALTLGVAACGNGNPFTTQEEGADPESANAFLTEEGSFLTLNNITYDPATDTLTLNNIPFDDPTNTYDRITGITFVDGFGAPNGFGAYDSNPAAGTNEIQYFAIFRRSDSGNSQVAAAGTTGYVDFGYGGAGAQRLGGDPTLPSGGIYSYNGEYGAVRTTQNTAGPGGPPTLEYVIGNANLRLDIDDFDDTGAVGGTITNRVLYNTAGAQVGTVAGFISLRDTDIDFTNGTIVSQTATEFDGVGAQTNSGNWEGVFAGPNGEEIAGILVIENTDVREVGGFVATSP